ncbi:hypothetical protein SAMN06264364_10659 [Quadrisphaera granulorum]|uniref:Uncharacterized protein n=1 Tax=Quadrisphaera granulorum TaxID=317664 RepID=A0A316A9M0_9ACTN|nr:hypothetical protein [Quadrisphaera granulorum]PWJ54616.1 hypothetical protein BXY45_10659 [Quadrisphaera granulorum]SZE95978.1 hypothetical protein SAMN06264364_10659 [Quadrisphaera granulorum]
MTGHGDGSGDIADSVDWNQTLEVCLDLARAANTGGLLTDATSIDAALTERGWSWGRRGGQWRGPCGLPGSGITELTPPSVEIILSHPDDAALFRVAEQIADRLEELLGAPESRGPVPGPHEQVDTDQQIAAVWQRPDLSVVVSFLPPDPSPSDTEPGEIPQGFLSFRLTRPDVTDSEEDAARACHLAQQGTVAERWHLTGQAVLPDDVITLLENDDDPRVAAAVRFGAERREALASRAR